MNLFDILKLRGFDLTARTKILRHRSSQYDIEEVFRGGYLNAYQSIQASDGHCQLKLDEPGFSRNVRS